MSPLDLMPPKAPPHCRKTTRSILCPVWVRRQRQRICFLNHEPAGLFLSDLAPSPCQSNDWMSLLLPSRASRTIPEPCHSFLTRCFRMSFQQPSGLYLSFAAPSLPSCSSVRRMILVHVRSFMCIKRSDITALTFTSEQDDSRALSLIDLLMFLLGRPPTCRAILECCRSVFAFAFISAQDDTSVRSIILMSIERLDVSALLFTG